MSVFVSPHELHDRLHSGEKQSIIAVLWEPKEGKAWSAFQSEHIPTAMYCDPSSTLAGLPSRETGRNPMPQLDVLSRAVREWGLAEDHPVYIYDTGAGLYAARAWWTLRWLGFGDVFIVDGGFRAWDAAGFETVAGPGNIAVGAAAPLKPGSLPSADAAHVRDFNGLLIDAREPNRYNGLRERFDLKAGHIPGAVNLPAYDLFAPGERTVRDVDDIRDRFAEAGWSHNIGPEDAVVYSGSGNHSSLLLAVAEHAGLPVVSHYVAGWSQWCGDRENPVARHV
ncbi:3-mercaptopyruvate sulfurtransferase [Corynebacterium capitovis DSM 44611]|uniref:sulfurtransferase n=1 Tax=Corynebacterium capitovis TaxID=131081 RepID=UPI00037019B4|nr:rhodanese-like domain-containing protein [Corynebacterium capitovis]WKD58227.1 3-mercaptopyruvate sulfurtransferase [Corynebacterium capitovis DSM 44611]